MLNTILICSATMAAVTLIALAASPLLERRYTRGAIYALWLAVVLGFLVPVRPNLPQKPAVTVEVPRVMSEPVRIARPVTAGEMQTTAATAARRTQAVTADASQAQISAAPRVQVTPAQALTALYLLGAAITLLAHLTRHARFMRTVRRFMRPVTDIPVLAAYDRAIRAMNVRRAPGLYACAAITSPMLAGIVHPVILLPEDAPAGEALDMVLRHELTHYRRGDLPLHAAMLLARAMHWFNPAVYLCERAAIHYGELSCDERAVRGTDRDQRAAYGGAILQALRAGTGTRSLLTTSFSADKRLLKKRLIAMMDMRARRRGVFIAVLALGLSALLGANLVLADQTPRYRPKEYEPEDVLGTYVLEGEQTSGATVTVHSGYNDGYLMLVTSIVSPNAEGEGVYMDVILGDGEPRKSELEEDGYTAVGVYCEGSAREGDGEWLYSRSGFGGGKDRTEDMTDVYLFSPSEPKGDLTVSYVVGLMETPGEILHGEDAMQIIKVTVPVTHAETRRVSVRSNYEELSRLKEVFIAETDRIRNIFLYYEDENNSGCPVVFTDKGDERHVTGMEEIGFDGTRALAYRWTAVYNDGPQDILRVTDWLGQVYAIDLNTGEVTAQQDERRTGRDVAEMPKEAMLAIYEDSTSRMNTVAPWSDGREFLKAYEIEMTARGEPYKEDMVISTLPKIYDMPYGEALDYACQLIEEKFGTPREELDAMGVYPTFYEYPYMSVESQWEFFFSPARDTDITLDHGYPGPGEYRVSFGSLSKDVDMCIWYIDDFWPYAERTWQAGKRDEVYERFTQSGFMTLDGQAQAMWTQRLKDAGYDVQIDRDADMDSLMLYDAYWVTAKESLLTLGTPSVETALAAIGREYRLTADQLNRYRYTASISPYNTGDVCVVFTTGARYGEADNTCIDDLMGYADRLGSFIAHIDAQTGELLRLDHFPYSDEAAQPGQPLLARQNWTADDLPEFEALAAQVERAVHDNDDDTWAQRQAVYPLMLGAGGNENRYTLPMLTPQEAISAARTALMEHLNLSEEEFAQIYQDQVSLEHFFSKSYSLYLHVREEAPRDWQGRNYYVQIDGSTGEAMSIAVSQGS